MKRNYDINSYEVIKTTGGKGRVPKVEWTNPMLRVKEELLRQGFSDGDIARVMRYGSGTIIMAFYHLLKNLDEANVRFEKGDGSLGSLIEEWYKLTKEIEAKGGLSQLKYDGTMTAEASNEAPSMTRTIRVEFDDDMLERMKGWNDKVEELNRKTGSVLGRVPHIHTKLAALEERLSKVTEPNGYHEGGKCDRNGCYGEGKVKKRLESHFIQIDKHARSIKELEEKATTLSRDMAAAENDIKEIKRHLDWLAEDRKKEYYKLMERLEALENQRPTFFTRIKNLFKR